MADDNLIAQIDDFLQRLDAVPEIPGRAGLAAAIRGLGDRVASRPRDLTYVLVFGPTGCGKSKLVNSLYGRELTPVGYRRPTTTVPHVVVPAEQTARVAPCLPQLPLRVVEVTATPWPGLVCIDAPDIDSVCLENHTLAETFLWHADAVLVVVTPGKYADESIWRYLRRFAQDGTELALVLNMRRDPGVLEDLQAKLAEAHIAPQVIAVPFDLGNDERLIAEGEGLVQLRARFEQWAASDALRQAALARSARNAVAALERDVLPWLASRDEVLAAARTETSAAIDAKKKELGNGLPFRLDEGTVATLYRRMLANLERIDPLRLPRRLLSYPFRMLREKLGRDKTPRTDAQAVAALWDLNEEAFVSATLDLGEALEARCRAGGFMPPARETEAELRARFRVFQSEFRTWIDAQAEAITRTLSAGQRVRFYAAQALVLGALVGIELHTGGMLTLTQVVTDGLVSPFAAKLIGMALSTEDSRSFREKARARYLQEAVRLLGAHTAPIEEALAARIADHAALRARASALCDAFRARGEHRP